MIDLNSIQKVVHGDGPICVVDDDEAQLLIIQKSYEVAGRQNKLLQFKNANLFIEYLEGVAAGTNAMPELVLLDIIMPGVDGFETLKIIRTNETFKKIPKIFMFTSSEREVDISKSLQLGATAFFSKPYKVIDYINFFKNI